LQTATKRALEPPEQDYVELPPHGRLPRLDLGVDWESPWREFRTSVGDFLARGAVPKDDELPQDSHLRVHWIRGRNSGWAFAASSAWHVAVVVLLILPIWGFLPATAHNLAPVQVELTWSPAQDLPPISLPAPGPKRAALPAPRVHTPEAEPQRGADAFHPRQTILSIPVRVTHPRQTLIQPDAPPTPPAIDPALPNVVQWAATAPVPRPQLQLSPSASAPKIQRRAAAEIAAPDVPNSEKMAGPLNIASSSVVNPQPQMPMAPMSAATARSRTRTESAGAAPEVGGGTGDANLRNVIALSSSPAPPAPVVTVPSGNLAARVAISPEGTRPGSPNGTGRSASGGGGGANGTGAAGAGGGTGSLPAAISVSGGSGHRAGSGGIGAGEMHSKLILKPLSSLPDAPTPNRRTGPANVATLNPGEAPEALLEGKEIHTLNINLPNLTSSSGSWVLNFAQLDEGTSPFERPHGTISGPVPMRKVDPKYPPDVMKENIEGEVVLYAIIRANGSVDNIQVARKLDPRLDKYAVEALAQWKFRPATRDGAPVDVEAIVHIPFRYHAPQD